MPLPPAFCNEHCGLGEQLPQFWLVQVPFRRPGFTDYWDGVVYEFAGVEGTRCLYLRKTPGAFPWTIEKLSRYPEGWTFFENEPNPGFWTWRLSIDLFEYVPPIVDLHGWLIQLPHKDPLMVDPLKQCESAQTLLTYVPFSLDPPARITPLGSAPSGIEVKNDTNPCFCNDECPLFTRPFNKYLIKHTGTEVIPGYNAGILYDNDLITGSTCRWQSVPKPIAPIKEEMVKTVAVPTTGDHAWNMKLTIQTVATQVVFQTTYEWNDDSTPHSKLDAMCDRQLVLTESAPASRVATIIPAPRWVCSTAQARSWHSGLPGP